MDTQAIAQIIKSSKKVIPIGGRSKPALSTHQQNGATPIDMTQLSGIVTYDPDEFTLTAKAGTPASTLIDAVGTHGQYLPFDPLLAEKGATLGGTVAANASGSGRFRYGGVRDFILGVEFIDGVGNIVRGGGKVVKNASGFDLPKFMVGSLGRYGVLTEITLKIFPRPVVYRSLKLTFASLSDTLDATFALANQPFEMDALDFQRTSRDAQATEMGLRVGGLAASLSERLDRLSHWIQTHTAVEAIEEIDDDAAYWAGVNRVAWAADAPNLVKIPVAPRQVQGLDQRFSILDIYYYAAGNVALATTEDVDMLDADLTELGLNGQMLWGEKEHPHLGKRGWASLARRVKRALDPEDKFLVV